MELLKDCRGLWRGFHQSSLGRWLSWFVMFLVGAGFVAGWMALRMPDLKATMETALASAASSNCAECEVPKGLTEADWESIVAAIERDQHQIQRTGDGTWCAFNPAHGLLAEFTSDGIVISPSVGDDESTWHWGLQLVGYGYGDRIRKIEKPILAVDGNRAEYRRGKLVEWYVNEARGVEQGFTLASPPAPWAESEPLELHLAYGANWVPELSQDSEAITWRQVGGDQLLQYSDLLAIDATGQKLTVGLDVRQDHIAILVEDSSAIYPITIDPFIQEARLQSADAGCGTDTDFGMASIAIDGDTVVAAADDALYVFVKPATGWADITETAKLTPSNGSGFYMPAIYGDTIVALGSEAGVPAEEASRVYVFEKPAGGWIDATEDALLSRSTSVSGDYHTDQWEGLTTLAFDGATVVAGSPGHGNTPTTTMRDIGMVYVWEKPVGGWADATEDATLDHVRTPGSAVDDHLGSAVAVEGDVVVASAYGADVAASAGGAVYVYVRPPTGWVSKTEDAVLTVSDSAVGDELGGRGSWGLGLAIDGETIVAGARTHPCETATWIECGAVYIFERPVTGWIDATEDAKLTPSDAGLGSPEEPWLGTSVDIHGDILVASGYQSSCQEEVGGDRRCWGKLYVFEKPVSGWVDATEDQRLIQDDAAPGCPYYDWLRRLGKRVQISGDTIIAGSYESCLGLERWGPVYVFGETLSGKGVVVIEKEIDPSDPCAEFTFSDTIPSQSSFTLGYGHQKSFNNVEPGTYTVTEDDPSVSPGGYYVGDITFVEDGNSNSTADINMRQATITVEADETIRCTYTNSEMTTVIVSKDTDPEGGTGFGFTDNMEAPYSFTLNDDENKWFRVPPGTYTISESDPGVSPSGYYLQSISCSDTDSSVDLETRTATIVICPEQAGQYVYCTFNNYAFATVTVTKLTSPADLPGSFSFTDDIEAPNAFSLGHGQTKTFSEVRQGTYIVTESDPSLVNSDLRLTDISFVSAGEGSWGSADLETRQATLHVFPADTLDVTFTNSEFGTIVVEKVTYPAGAPGSFQFTNSATAGQPFTLADEESETFHVPPGTYSVIEEDPSVDPGGFVLSELAVVEDGTSNSYGDRDMRTATANVEVGETVTCTFTNIEASQAGTIIVEKATDPPGAPDTFGFQVDIRGLHSRNLTDGQSMTYSNLLPGTYTVTENPPPTGFALASLSFAESVTTNSVADLGTRTATIHLEAGETVTCKFTNGPSDVEADLAITKSDSPSPVCAGSQLTYTLSVDNNGPDTDPTTITVTDTLPAGATFVSASGSGWSCSEAAGVVTCTRPTGLSVTTAPAITITVAVDPGTSGTITNNVSVSSAATDPTPGNDSASVQTSVLPLTPSADLAIAKSDNPDPILTGTKVFYTLTVTNNGPDAAAGVTVVDTAPAPANIPYVVVSQGTYTVEGNVITCNLGDLGSGATATITIVVKRNVAGIVTNTATVSANVCDPNLVNNTVSQDTTFSDSCPTGTVIVHCSSSTGVGIFSFEGNIERPSFDLGTGGPRTFNNVSVGTYFITEQDPSGVGVGYAVTDVSCVEDVSSNSTADVFGRTITINVEAGETVTCTFTNTEASQATGTIVVEKLTSPAGGTGFGFTDNIESPNSFSLDHGQSKTFASVPMGRYTVTETDPSGLGFSLSSIVCDDGDSTGDVGTRTATIKVEVGETVTCTFTNSQAQPDTAAVFRVEPSGNVFGDQTVHAAAFQTGAADVAEWVTVSEPVEPGDVLELNPTVFGAYRRTSGPCSTLIAGVVSTEPGFTLGYAGPLAGGASLALVGIVPARVTNEGGPILPGDLLVSSSTPGYAMRWSSAEPCPCVLIGKALEPMVDERGVVLVLLTAH